eukprot:COSAG01_NODE_3826_length_5656_cov_12.085478_2_plen_74_part_00
MCATCKLLRGAWLAHAAIRPAAALATPGAAAAKKKAEAEAEAAARQAAEVERRVAARAEELAAQVRGACIVVF